MYFFLFFFLFFFFFLGGGGMKISTIFGGDHKTGHFYAILGPLLSSLYRNTERECWGGGGAKISVLFVYLLIYLFIFKLKMRQI